MYGNRLLGPINLTQNGLHAGGQDHLSSPAGEPLNEGCVLRFLGGDKQELFAGTTFKRRSRTLFSHRCWSLGCQLSLIGGAPFVLMLLLSARHIRGPVVVGIHRSSAAAGGRAPRWPKSWRGLGWKEQRSFSLAANRAWLGVFALGSFLLKHLPVVPDDSE